MSNNFSREGNLGFSLKFSNVAYSTIASFLQVSPYKVKTKQDHNFILASVFWTEIPVTVVRRRGIALIPGLYKIMFIYNQVYGDKIMINNLNLNSVKNCWKACCVYSGINSAMLSLLL